MGDDGPGPGARRRTDPADALWRGGVPTPREALAPPVADRRPPVRPVLAPEARAVRMPPGSTSRSARALEDVRAAGRPRPPMPPVPPPVLPVAGPRTTAAPFDAVPTPEREPASSPVATALEERPQPSRIAVPVAAASRSAAVPNLPPRPLSAAATPVVPRSPSMPSTPLWDEDEPDAPWKTGRGAVRAPRVPGRSEGAPAVERRASRLPAGGVPPATGPGNSPAYGDWTKPSGSGRVAVATPAPAAAPAPLTTAIPDREVAGRRPAEDDLDLREDADGYDDDGYDDDGYDGDVRSADRYDDDLDDDLEDDLEDELDDDLEDDLDDDPDDYDEGPGSYPELDRPGPETSPGTGSGSVVGGRAASRAERQAREEARLAAEAARRKAARRTGSVSLDEDERPRRPRRLLTGLVAVGAVAAAVLGVYTITTPEAEVAGSQSAATSSASASDPTGAPETTAALPPLDTAPAPVEVVPAAPVRVPVTVLNATEITGLAADISGAIAGNGQGWTTETPGGYPNGDVAATTVYFTEGDAQQEQAALQLKEQFPQLSGPAPRFFEVPAEVPAPGLVIVAAGDWKP